MSTPNFNHQIHVINLPDGTSQYAEQNQLITDGMLSLTQNIPWTGGTFSLRSGLQRLDLYGKNRSYTYKSSPVIVSYEQSLFGYNSLKWEHKIEPLRFEEAKRSYVERLELIATQTTTRFFNLARVQTNLDIAKTNYANADTLYTFAKGRYNIGTITENEMLQLEVNRLNEESNMLNAQLEMDDYMEELRSHLGISDAVAIEVAFDDKVPAFHVDLTEALQKALINSPEMISMERSKLTIKLNSAENGMVARIVAEEGSMLQEGDTLLVLSNPELLRIIEDERDELEKQQIAHQEKMLQMRRKTSELQRTTLKTIYELEKLEKQYSLDKEEFHIGIRSKAQLEVASDDYDFIRKTPGCFWMD